MTKICVDTSILVKWFYSEDESEKVSELFSPIENSATVLCVPGIITIELSNVLLMGKKFTSSDTLRALDKFYSLEAEIIPESSELIKKTIAIAQKHQVTTYDAIFIALSEVKDIPLFTADYKHHVKSISKNIIWLSEWNGKI